MKTLLTLSIILSSLICVNSVLESNRRLVMEIDGIMNMQRICIEKYKSDERCSYNCALKKLNYPESASNLTKSYRTFCLFNTSALRDECERHEEFTNCLHREVQSEINHLRDLCVNKHQADMQAYRNGDMKMLIKDQRYACFMFCFQKALGNMNEDLSFNLYDKLVAKTRFNLTEAIEDCARTDREITLCSKAAYRYYCLEQKYDN